jgi:putative RecB family exonuclease
MTSATSAPALQRPPGAQVPDGPAVLRMLADIDKAATDGRTDLQRLPTRLSPSRANDYKQCPRLFYYRTLVGLSSPPTAATARGTVAHTAFERIFDHPAGTRTPELAKSYLAAAWEELVNPMFDPTRSAPEKVERDRLRSQASAAAYRALAPAASQAEADILEYAAQMVTNWFSMEHVNNFNPAELTLPNGTVIDGRELHVGAPVAGTHLHGFIDRLDRWDSTTGPVYFVSDYKTGKVPGAGKRYRAQVMERIAWESFFQLRVYALLAFIVYKIPIRQLRLIYVATGDREAGIKTLTVNQGVLDRTAAEVLTVWESITASATAQTWPPKTGPLCGWCYFADVCPAFNTAP